MRVSFVLIPVEISKLPRPFDGSRADAVLDGELFGGFGGINLSPRKVTVRAPALRLLRPVVPTPEQKVIERDIPELVEAMDRGKVTTHAAA